jgi:hypothetical protein
MKRVGAAIAVVAVFVLGPGSARADKCTAAKLRAVGKKESGLLACQSKVAVKGSSVEPSCDNKVNAKYGTAYDKPGPCGAPAKDVCEALADECRDALRAALPDGDPNSPSRCEAARLKAAGKKASAKLTCYAKAAIKGTPVDSAPNGCLDRATAKFTAAFNKITGCTGDNAVQTIESLIDSKCVDQVVSVDGTGRVTAICPGPTTTTTTTTTTTSTTTPMCDVCTEGPALDPGCSACAAAVCVPGQDPSCCDNDPNGNGWDAICIAEACTVCGAEQAPCPGTPCAP